MEETLDKLAIEVGQALARKQWRLVTAESCTGGWIAKTCTDIPGSSEWFDRGFVTYSNSAKQEMLGVSAKTLEGAGAVSEATVREMVKGALSRSEAQVAIAVSGIAGPLGGTEDKPVGTVFIAWAFPDKVMVRREGFSGDRESVRRQSVQRALSVLRERLYGGH